VDQALEVLRRLTAADRYEAADALSAEATGECELDRRTRALVQLSALLADDAGTASVRWAADVAAATGADDATLVRVLITAASAAGAAQVVKSAPRLALALDVDLELEGWDGT
jgi:hypothetical protein